MADEQTKQAPELSLGSKLEVIHAEMQNYKKLQYSLELRRRISSRLGDKALNEVILKDLEKVEEALEILSAEVTDLTLEHSGG